MPRSATSGRHRQQPCLEDCRQRIFSGRVVCLHPRRHAFTRHTAAGLSIFGCPRNRGNSKSGDASEHRKQDLQRQFAELNPVELQRKVIGLQQRLSDLTSRLRLPLRRVS